MLNEEEKKILVFRDCHSQDGLGTSFFITQNGEAVIVLKHKMKKCDWDPLGMAILSTLQLKAQPSAPPPRVSTYTSTHEGHFTVSSSSEMEFLLKWALGMNGGITALVVLGQKNDAVF